MLTGLNMKVSKTQDKLNRADDRLKSLIAKKPNKFYYMIILVECILILLVLFYFD
jgi:hypothetical protein